MKRSSENVDSDLSLVEQVLAGDSAAFEELVRKHERRVFRATLSICGNQQDAEDAMQETFLKLYRRIGDFRRESRLSTWLTSIAVNEALQRRRARKQSDLFEEITEQTDLPAPQNKQEWYANPEKRYARQEIRAFVEDAIRVLGPEYRVAFVLRDVEGLRTEEAAEVLSISVPALKSRLLRARLTVRESLAKRFEKRPGFKARIVRAGAILRQSVSETISVSRWKRGA